MYMTFNILVEQRTDESGHILHHYWSFIGGGTATSWRLAAVTAIAAFAGDFLHMVA
jgi:hypothetical protein